MKTLVVDATWKKKLVLKDSVINYLKKKGVKTVALFASVQFLALEHIEKKLEQEGYRVLKTRAKRTHAAGQVLGCDCYSDSFADNIISKADVLLYIGDGMFHPKALLLSQIHSSHIKEVVIWDPVAEEMKIITKKDIENQMKRMKRNLKLFVTAKTVGVLVTVKPGQQYIDLALQLKKKLEKEGKKVFVFVDNTFDYAHMENYPFVKVWVNTACPRIGTDDITTIEKPLLNVREAMDPINALERLG